MIHGACLTVGGEILERGDMLVAVRCVVWCVCGVCDMWQTELSFVVASLSFCSAHVSVDPTVVVRVMLD